MVGNVNEWVLDYVGILDSMMPAIPKSNNILIDPIWNIGEYGISRGGCVISSIYTLLNSNTSIGP